MSCHKTSTTYRRLSGRKSASEENAKLRVCEIKVGCQSFESSEKANCRVGILIIDVASSFSGRVGDFSLGDRSTGEYVGAVAHHETDLASHVFDTVTCGDSARTCMEGNSKAGERKSKSEKEEEETGRSVAAKPRQEGAFYDKVLACALHNCLVCAYLLGGRLGNPTQQKSHRTGSQ